MKVVGKILKAANEICISLTEVVFSAPKIPSYGPLLQTSDSVQQSSSLEFQTVDYLKGLGLHSA